MYLEACFAVIFLGSYPDILHHSLNLPFFLPLLFPCHEVCDHQQEVNSDSFFLSGAFRALCKYKEHDPGNFFSPRKGKSSTCQSVILSISSHKGTQSSPCLNPSRWRGRGAGGRSLALLNDCDQL